MAKTHNNKEDFIDKLAKMSQNEINDYIKAHGKKPKFVTVCRELTKEELEQLTAK